MIGALKAAGLGVQVGAALGGLALLAGASALFVMQVRGVYKDGMAAADAKWKAEIAATNLEHERALGEARAEGRAERAAEVAAAQARAASAREALERARDEDPDFDAALRARWPRDYFISVCGDRPDCLPPSGDDQR